MAVLHGLLPKSSALWAWREGATMFKKHDADQAAGIAGPQNGKVTSAKNEDTKASGKHLEVFFVVLNAFLNVVIIGMILFFILWAVGAAV